MPTGPGLLIAILLALTRVACQNRGRPQVTEPPPPVGSSYYQRQPNQGQHQPNQGQHQPNQGQHQPNQGQHQHHHYQHQFRQRGGGGGSQMYGSGALRPPQPLPLPHVINHAHGVSQWPRYSLGAIPFGAGIHYRDLPLWYRRGHMPPPPPRSSGRPPLDLDGTRSGGVPHRTSIYDPLDEEQLMNPYQRPGFGLGPLDDADIDLDEGVEGCGGWCRGGEFLCAGSCTCIPVSWRCDGVEDCVNSEDESACSPSSPQQLCDLDSHIRCPRTWKCIKKEWICDGDDDCGDFSDETHCGVIVNCTSEEFECNNGLCILTSWLCDGDNDCRDFSDEVNCTSKSDCTVHEFRCSDGTCISLPWKCDLQPDCSDQSDELDCPEIEAPECGQGELQCAYPRCVREEFRCDGDDDCGDWSDENDCPKVDGGSCTQSEFRCESGKCIPKIWHCDKERDCENGEDESHCEMFAPRTCTPEEFSCQMGNCISKSWVCDSVQDCSQGEDEKDCKVTCHPQTQFTCRAYNISSSMTVNCIHKKHVCDDKKDCPTGDDELNCPVPKNCSLSSKKCKQLCVQTYDGKDACTCRPGYVLDDDSISCKDIDECSYETDPVCSQVCNNTIGSYVCGCFKGYILRPDGKTCKALGAPPTLLFANRIDIRQVSLNNLQYTAILKGLHNAIALDYHYKKGFIFWSDVSMDTIRRARTNGTNATDIIRWGLDSPGGVAVDWVHDLLFWTDSGTRRVEVSTLDGHIRHVLASDDLDKPRAIGVHPGEALVFWTDWGPKPKIERCEMDGSNRMSIITKSVLWPNGLSIDYPSNRIYWADAKHHVIECAKLDGSERRKVVAKGLPHPFALTLFEDAIYWTDWHTKSISTANKGSGSGFRTIHSGLHHPMDIHSYHPQRQPNYTNHCGADNGGCSHLCLPNRINFQCVCPLGFKLTKNNRTCDTTTDLMLLFARKKDLRLRSIQEGIPNYDIVLPIEGIKSAVALAWDSNNKAIFWSDMETATISTAKINGKDQHEVVNSNLASPAGLAIDWVTNKLYWTDANTKRIEVSRLDGTYRSLLVWDKLEKPRDIVVDPIRGYMYWSDLGTNASIERAGMHGKNRSSFITENIKWPNGLAIDFDKAKLYWTDAGTKTIECVGLDGKGRISLMTSLPHPFGLAILNDKLYWTDWDTKSIHVADKSTGKNSTVLRSTISGLMDIKVMDHEKDVVQSKCHANNAGCSHLCLIAPNEDRYICACPIGISLLDDGKTCASSPSTWLIVAHRKEIRQIALDTPYTVAVVLPFPQLNSAVAVDVDGLTGDIYWSDNSDEVIQKAKPDGSGLETVVTDRLDTVDGIAIDSAGRKLYWTDSGSNSIQVCDLNNCELQRRVLIWNHLDNPRGIMVHYGMGLLFWTDWGSQPRIEQSDMDGNNRVTLVSENLGWPNGLAIDNGQLYWTDAQLKLIETSPLSDPPNRTVILDKLAHPYALYILDDYIYWTDWGAKAVLKANKYNGSEMTALVSNLDGLMDLKVVQPRVVEENVCGTNNGGCSHLCLRSPKGFTCSCPTGIVLQSDKKTCVIQPNAYLLFATRMELIRISLDTPEMWAVTLPTGDLHKVVAVDFHWNLSAIFYADVHLKAIRGVSMMELTKTWDVVTNLTMPEGIAVDWLANNLYWTDSEQKTLEVARIDGRGRKIIIPMMEEPRSVAVYPQRGYLFWTDWGDIPKIERSYMDGSHRQVIVESDLGLPNGLALDYTLNKLYWADALKDHIEMSDLRGKDRVQLIPEATHPFGLAQFEDHIYWSDWHKEIVERADAMMGRDRTVLRGKIQKVLDICAVAETKQQGWNPCAVNNGHCTHFCFYRGRYGYACACPDITTPNCSTEPSSRVADTQNFDLEDLDEDQLEDSTLPQGSSTALLVTSGIIANVIFVVICIIASLLYNRRKTRQKKFMYSGGRSVLTFSNPNYSMSTSDVGRTTADKKPFIWRKLRYDKSQDRVFAVHGDGDKGGSAEVVSLISVPATSPCPSPTPTNSIALEMTTSNC